MYLSACTPTLARVLFGLMFEVADFKVALQIVLKL
jgi:hypothetical protein